MPTVSKSPALRRPAEPQPVASARSNGSGMRTDNQVEIITPEQYADRRAEPRVKCNDRGALLLLSGYDIVPCRILDQSQSGARIAFQSIGRPSAEIWMIDLDSNMAKRGSPAWIATNTMGLKFNFAMAMIAGRPRPAKIPQPVFDAWLKLSGQAPVAPPTEDVLYFD